MCIRDRNELERILDILQSIRDREVGRRPLHNNNNNNNNTEFNHQRNNYHGNNNNMHRTGFHQSGEWSCSRCRCENYANRQQCFKCKLPREDQRGRDDTKQFGQQNRGAPHTRGTPNHNQGLPRGHQGPTTSNHRQQQEN